MPFKKKNCVINQNREPGVAKQHLINVFGQLPADCNSVMNGHVLYLYAVKCEKSLALTRKKLCTFINHSSMSVLQCNSLLLHLNSKIRILLNKTLKKMKAMPCSNNSKQFQEFDSICRRTFPLIPPDNEEEPLTPPDNEEEPLTPPDNEEEPLTPPDNEEEEPNFPNAPQPDEELIISVQQPDTSSSLDATQPLTDILVPVYPSPLKTRQLSKCDICETMRKEMIGMRKEMLQLQSALATLKTNTIVRARKGKNVSVKRLNQKLKRKEEQLLKVKKMLEESPVTIALKTAHDNIRSLEKSNKRIKSYYKRKALTRSSVNADDDSMVEELERNIDGKKEEINILENEADTVQEMEVSVIGTKSDQESYSPNMRMMVFDTIVSQVPTGSVPKLIANFACRCNVTLKDIPHRSTVESIARELGVISDFQAAEALISSKDSTLAFNVTAQEDVHVHEIHFITEKDCYSIALDELPGRLAADYATHITDSIDNLADVYSYFNCDNFLETKIKLLDNINSLTDRASNPATIRLVNEAWGKCLNELNCQLHPLDPISTKVRSALKKYEKENHFPKKLLESDCLAQSHNINSKHMMEMFSAARGNAPAATLCYISSKLRAQKNKTVDYLDSLDGDKREDIIKKAVNFGKKQREQRKSRQKNPMVELSNRQVDKQLARDTTERKKLKFISVEEIANEFPLLSEDTTTEWEGNCSYLV